MTIFKRTIKIILAGVFFFVVVANMTKFKLIASGDNSWFVNPLFFNRQFVWDKTNFGSFYQIADVIPIGIFYQFFHLFKLSNNYIQTLYYTFFYFGSFISFYFSFKSLLPKSNRLAVATAGLLYVFNPYILIAPFQDRLFPVLIFLPLLFLLYYRLLHNRKIKFAILISLISILFSGSNINPPIVSIIFIIFAAYFIYFLASERLEKGEYRTLFLQQFVLIFFYSLVNLWHFIVDIPSMLAVSDIASKVNQFRAIDAGYFFDHLRLIGQWAWNQSHYLYKYFPFSPDYYKPLLALTTYSITFLGLVIIFCLPSRKFQSAERKIYYFFLLMFLFGALLANGTKGQLGLIYNILYNSSQILWMFREPWAKFTPIMVFALPIMIIGSLSFVDEKFSKNKIKLLFFALVILFILINVFPLFDRSAIWNKWNGTMRDSRVEVPAYWGQMTEIINNNLAKDERVAIFPFNSVYMAFNWPHGYFASSNPARLLLSNPIVVSSSLPFSYSDSLYNKTFDKLSDPNFNLAKYLGVMNTRYILEENDADWRYSEISKLTPAESDKLISEKGFKKIAETGVFSPDYLKQIPNDEPNQALRKELSDELLGRPALILWRANDDKYFLPHLYSGQKIIKTNRNFTDMADIVSDPNYDMRSVVYFEKQNQDNNKSIKSLPDVTDSSPDIEFKKVNPTKYNLIAHGASGKFTLVFNESYDKNWQIFSDKIGDGQIKDGSFWQNWFKKPTVEEDSHLLTNGYANSWIIDANSVCGSQCKKNPDGTFDTQLSVEFSQQKSYQLGIVVSSLAYIILIGYLFSIYWRKKNDQK